MEIDEDIGTLRSNQFVPVRDVRREDRKLNTMLTCYGVHGVFLFHAFSSFLLAVETFRAKLNDRVNGVQNFISASEIDNP